ncbi:ABC transporter ATP-binding protein, partial [Megamonas funiformis]
MEIISEQVKKFIGNKEILKGINIDVKNKEFLGIIGPNGSGKSTFLKCIYRILKPSE